eukprot:2458998-Alexandrium_andersonii.AAC.1
MCASGNELVSALGAVPADRASLPGRRHEHGLGAVGSSACVLRHLQALGCGAHPQHDCRPHADNWWAQQH